MTNKHKALDRLPSHIARRIRFEAQALARAAEVKWVAEGKPPVEDLMDFVRHRWILQQAEVAEQIAGHICQVCNVPEFPALLPGELGAYQLEVESTEWHKTALAENFGAGCEYLPERPGTNGVTTWLQLYLEDYYRRLTSFIARDIRVRDNLSLYLDFGTAIDSFQEPDFYHVKGPTGPAAMGPASGPVPTKIDVSGAFRTPSDGTTHG